jgi:hypothetical protein
LAAPLLSPLSGRYRDELIAIAETLNRIMPGSINAEPFDGLANGVALLERIASKI